MRIICNILVVLFVTATAVGQQINPVPDYIFRNSMSVGRNAPTDTSAYFSIGPRFGATRGFMPPMVVDTAAVTGTKRNGLLIYSIQRNSFLYWDSTGMRWSRIAANLDTLLLSTRAWRQKGIDSLASVRVGGSGTINRVPKFTAAGTIGDGSIADSSTSVRMTILSGGNIGVATAAPAYLLDVAGSIRNTSNAFFNTTTGESFFGTTTDVGNYRVQVAGGLYNTTAVNLATSSGNVVIGGTGTGNYKLDVVGGGRIVSQDTTLGSFVIGGRSDNLSSAAKNGGILTIYDDNGTYPGIKMGVLINSPFYPYIQSVNANNTFGILSINPRGGNVSVGSTGTASYNLDVGGSLRSTTDAYFNTSSGETYIGTTSDAGAFKLQVNGVARASDGLATGAPAGGTAATWKLGIVVAGSYTAASNYLQVDVGGTLYYIGLVTPD